jgi:prepilin-type N-terminal cleavage/methylation domain-containing protein
MKKSKTLREKAAFTLAEVLITIGIIGVVAALTIPTLIKKQQDMRFSAILKEDYSIINQALRKANDDEATFRITTLDNLNNLKIWVNTYFLPYMKVAKICYDEAGCWSGNDVYLNGKDRKSSWLNSEKGCGSTAISMVLNNGSVVCVDEWWGPNMYKYFSVTDTSYNGLVVYLDLNGQNPPNVLGKDIFILGVDQGDQMAALPAGRGKTINEVKSSCSSTGDGMLCMQLAVMNGFKLPVAK